MKTFATCTLLGLLLGLAACVKEPDFSSTPMISFQGFKHTIQRTPDRLGNTVLRDSVVFSLGFQDGDGDLGITQDEFNGKGDPKLKGVNNYMVRVFRRKSGTFVEAFPQVPYSSFFPILNSKRGAIEGTLDFSQTFYQTDPSRPLLKDTLKFQIKVLDRALHESNSVETDTVMVYPPVFK